MAFTHPSYPSSVCPSLCLYLKSQRGKRSSGSVERTYQSRDLEGCTYQSSDPEGYTYQSGDPEGCTYQSSDPKGYTYQSSDPEGCTYQSGDPEGYTYHPQRSPLHNYNIQNIRASVSIRKQLLTTDGTQATTSDLMWVLGSGQLETGVTTSDGLRAFDDGDAPQFGRVRRPALLQRGGRPTEGRTPVAGP
ncbi:NBS-LRR type resistance protein [Cucumis melo var. makuwa]|uniref:NBS-LRR type resistance protein n=1 Tax=Cucumis melo var. makuwa TaxID=1194695 RepID=A0A5A7T6H3_CUCMM|nr:NBS-LRR type resistance protein [Cucumis melo var. makuwa]